MRSVLLSRRDVLLATLFPVLLLLASCGPRESGTAPYFPVPEQISERFEAAELKFDADTVAAGLERPYSFTFLPDGRALITERRGVIRIVENGALSEETVQGEIPPQLREIVLHPDYERNGWIYVSWYQDPDEEDGGYYHLMRGRLDGNRWTDREDLYRAGPFELNSEYTGSRIAFDPEGYLYFLVPIRGDRMHAQDLLHHSGKTMRLRDDGSVPDDNPFYGREDALPEIFTWGHREHQGLAQHPVTGELWSTEHGEFTGDELNILRAGNNYGWPLASWSREYRDQQSPVSEDPLLEGTEPPIHYWTPSIVPSGFTFVTGDRYPQWDGGILVASLTHLVPIDTPPRLLNLSILDGDRVVSDHVVIEAEGRTRSVKQAPDGYVYFVVEDGGVMMRLLPVE